MAQRQFRSDDTSIWSERYGNGSDGALVISSHTTFSALNMGVFGSNSSGQKTLNVASGGFANGDLVLIHQSRGTSAGGWELNVVASGGGTANLVMKYDLTFTYNTSGADAAQIVKLYQYSSVTINSGIIWSGGSWDGTKGGIVAFLCNGDTNVTGIINTNNLGFVGGAGRQGTQGGVQADGYPGVGNGAVFGSANGNGGGGGRSDAGNRSPGGGGGGSGASGTAGSASNGNSGGDAGVSFGTANLVTAGFGGGGGGGGKGDGTAGTPGGGGTGAGFVLAISKAFTVTGAMNSSGSNGANGTSTSGGGGGGAGGQVLIKSQVATLGSGLITALGGSGGSASGGAGAGGAGASGRIHLDYLLSYSGTTNPSFDVTQDLSLTSISGGAFIPFL